MSVPRVLGLIKQNGGISIICIKNRALYQLGDEMARLSLPPANCTFRLRGGPHGEQGAEHVKFKGETAE